MELQEITPKPMNVKLDVEINIIEFIAGEFDITPEQLTSIDRRKEFVLPRQIAMYYFSAENMKLFGSQFYLHTLRKYFPNHINHSNVIHAYNTIKNELAYPCKRTQKIKQVLARLYFVIAETTTSIETGKLTIIFSN